MKKLLFTLVAAICSIVFAQAQYETVVLNYEKSYFGENQPLPAEKYFMLNGVVGVDIHFVEVKIYEAKGKEGRDPLFDTFWKKDKTNNSPSFNIPINYKLKEGKPYDILFNFYRPVTEKERAKLADNVYNTLGAYIDQSFEVSNKRMRLIRNERQMINDMNNIVDRGMSLYRNRTQVKFESFSDMVKLKIKQIEGVKLRKAEKLGMGGDDDKARLTYRNEIIEDLKTLARNEVAQYMNGDLYVLSDDKFIDNYQTEKVKEAYYLAPHIGYGGVIFNTEAEDFNYGSGVYAGLSFPLAKQSKSAFLSRTSVNIGAFLKNLEDVDGKEVSGPVFKVPVYASLGYRPFAFFRIQAGATFLEDVSTAGDISGFENRVEIRPFIGISAEFNIWFNFGK